MRKLFLVVVIIFFGISVGFSQEAGRFFFEIGGGYNLSLGSGLYQKVYGTTDDTGTFYNQSYLPEGFTGFDINGKLGFGVIDNLIILCGVDYKFGQNEWTSANTWEPDGSIKYEHSYNLSWSALSINPGFRVYTDTIGFLKLFTGAGALICMPSDTIIEYTDNDPDFKDYDYEKTYIFNQVEYGAYGEFGIEFVINELFGINISVAGNLLDMTIQTYEYKRYLNGKLEYAYTSEYVDEAKIDTNYQTEDDIANSDAEHKYTTFPKKSNSFSGVEFKIGFTIRL